MTLVTKMRNFDNQGSDESKSPSSSPALFLSPTPLGLARPVHRLHVQTGSSLLAHEECPCDASCTVCVPCPAMSALCRTLDKVSRSAEKRCEKQMISCALRRWHLRPIVSFLFIRCASSLLVRVLIFHRSEKSSCCRRRHLLSRS